MAEHDRERAEEACWRAEELFRAGNIRGAHRQASKANRLCPSLPGVASALAAAAGANWRAVLGIRPGAAATRDAIKKRFRRLSLLVHPDKNRCTAAEEAFKLLRQAFDDALRGDTGPCAAHDERPRTDESTWKETPPQWSKPSRRIVIYCASCENQLTGHVGPMEEEMGMKCAYCSEWLNPPWQKKPLGRKEPPARMGFPCPVQCPKCEAQYTTKVSVGKWLLKCKACSKPTIFDVRGPNMATPTS